MEIALQIMKYWVLAWALSGMITSLGEFIESDKLIPSIIKLALTCLKCVSFWLTLIISQDVYMASLVSLIMYLWSNSKYNKISL